MRPAAPSPAPLAAEAPTSLVGGRYRVERVLGQAGRKRVYLARAADDRPVALALFDTEGVGEAMLARARRETQAMGRLGEHRHIVAILESGEDDGRPYIASEHMPGGDVASLLDAAEGRHLEVERALEIAIDVCHALEHAHGCGVVHRDLKPANIWIGEDGRARLGGFGLALMQGGDERESTLVGTVAYLPPEQALGRPAGARSDLYSLGALIYEMLTGQPPFAGDDAVAIIGQHLSAAPVAPSKFRRELPAGVDELVLGLLAKEPSERPPSATAVRRELEALARAPAAAATPVSDGVENPLDRLAGGVFVGRERELGEMRGAVDETLAGSGRLVLLVGEPGIGKTRTAEELATYARVRGAKVHWGRCQEAEGVPAYWPWAEAIRSYLRESDPVALAWELGSRAAEVARIVPELRERLEQVPDRDQAQSDEEARFRLFDSVSGFLAAAARSRPLVLVLDDLHWADEPSLLLLRFLARRLGESPLLVVATYRDVELGRHHPLAATLAELAQSERTRRTYLRGLDEPGITRYVEMSTGRAPAPGLVAAIREQTAGNPFFVSEVVRLLASEGRLDEQAFVPGDWELEIPQGVREVVGRRLDRLSEAVNSCLTVAAAIGREFEIDVLARACGWSVERASEVLAPALAARIVTESPRGVGRLAFAHALVRETLYAEIAPTQRPAMHQRIAAAIEDLYADDIESHLAELSHHFVEAAAVGDPDRAAAYARRAAREATERLAHEDAMVHLQRARDALALARSPDPRVRLEIALELGEAQIRAGRYGVARESFEQSAGVARQLDDAGAFARAALGAAGGSEAGSVDRMIVGLLEEALAGAGAADGALRSRLLSALAAELYWEDPAGKAEPLSAEALEMARRSGDEQAVAEALTRRQFAAGNDPSGARTRLEEAAELIELGRRCGQREHEVRGHAFRIRAFLELGEVAAADRELGEYERLATSMRQPQHLWHVPLLRGTRAMMEGRFDDAERLQEEALAGGERIGEPIARQFTAVQRALLLRQRGRFSEVRPVLEEMAKRFPAVSAWRCALANVAAELGDREGAREAYEPIAADDFEAIPYDAQWLIAVALLAEVAAFLGDRPRAQRLHEMLAPYEDLVLIAGRAAASYGPVARPLGLLARACGRLDDGERHLRDAVALCLRSGERPFAARARWELAELLLERGGEGDRERAEELLAEALDSARELGMQGLVERALATRLELQGLAGVDVTTSIESVIEAVADERPDLSAHMAADGTVTILFSDIEDSTLMTERLGDERWLDVLRAHNAVFRRRLREHGGYEVKSQGDGFMLVFAEPREALACAAAIQRDLAAAEVADEEPIRVRMGLHTGEAIRDEDDLFGRSVILAARIAAQARGGQILVSDRVREAAADGGFNFDDERELELKGLAGTHRVFAAQWPREPAQSVAAGA